MPDLNFVDSSSFGETRVTSDGYLVTDVLCARTGCQEYIGSEIGMDTSDTVTVYRPEEAVFARDSLSTYAGKPVTRGHPPVMVDSSNWKEYAVGDIGEDIVRDGEFVRVPMRLMDQATIDAVKSGEREISMGYTTPVEHRDGVAPDGTRYQAVQTGPIKINHLAVVPVARGGSNLRIGDGADNWGAAPQTTERKNAMPESLRSILVDGLTVQTTDQGAQAIEKLQNIIADARASVETKDGQIATLTSTIETKDGEITALKSQLADATSPKALNAAARARSALIDAAAKKGKKKREDYEEMEDAAIRRSVVTDHLGETAADMTDAHIEGAFSALSSAPAAPAQVLVQTQDADPWASFTKKEAS